jgi:hypothetical protein
VEPKMKMLIKLFWAAIFLIGCGNSDGQAQKATSLQLTPIDHSYTAYSQLLKDFVAQGLVDYKNLKISRGKIDSLVNEIQTADIETATKNQRLAFYINAYNILTMRSIIDAYPVASIRDINGVWDKKKWSLGGQLITLNQIENDCIRPIFADPRIHFALVCAAKGCPPLQSTPFVADSIDIQLNHAAIGYCTDENYNRLDTKSGKAELSQIFEWYGDDFAKDYYNPEAFPGLSKKDNAVLSFVISQYPAQKQDKFITAKKFEITYTDYDWSLNGQD